MGVRREITLADCDEALHEYLGNIRQARINHPDPLHPPSLDYTWKQIDYWLDVRFALQTKLLKGSDFGSSRASEAFSARL